DFEVWVDYLQLFLQCDREDGLSLFDLTSGPPAPPPPLLLMLTPLDHFLSVCPTTLTVDLLEKALLAIEKSIVAVGASRGDPRTPVFEGVLPHPLLPSVASAAAADLVGFESVGAASAPSGRRRTGKGKGARALEGVEGAVEVVVEAAEGVGWWWSVPGVAVAAAAVEAAEGVEVAEGAEAAEVVEEAEVEEAAEAAEAAEGRGRRARWWMRVATLRQGVATVVAGVAIFDLDFDAILAAMYAFADSVEGACYLCVPPDLGIEAAALGAPGSSLYTLTAESPPTAESAQVAASSRVFAAASRSGPESAPCSCRLLSHQTLSFGNTALGHPSLPRLRGMASRVLVSGLPRSLPPLPLGPGPTCVPCVEGRQRAAPHSSEFPPTEAPLQTLHMDVWGPARVSGQGRERYFLLVVDDYSRYTTVFPLRSKGDVTEYVTHQLNLQPGSPCERPPPPCGGQGRLAMRLRFGSGNLGRLSATCLRTSCPPVLFLASSLASPLTRLAGSFNHPTTRRVLSSQDVTFDESVPYYRLFPYRTAPLPPPPLFLAPGATQVDPLPPHGPAPSAWGCWVCSCGRRRCFVEAGSRSLHRSCASGSPAAGDVLLSLGVLLELLSVLGAAGGGAAGGVGAGVSTGAGASGGAAEAGAAGGVGAGDAAGAGDSEGTGVGAVGAGGSASAGAAAGDTGALQSQLQPASPLPAPSPYTGPTGGLAERREPASRPTSPVRAARTSRRAARPRPPPVPGTHQMALRPSTAPLRVPLPSPPESSLPSLANPESDSLRAASPSVTRLLATVVTDPSFQSTAASALVAELVDFAARCCLDYAASLVAESESVCPLSVEGECALSTDVLEDRQEEFQCFAAALPHLVSTLIAPKGDPDAPDIPTPRSYAEAIEGPYSSQWQSAMDAEMASWKSTGTYVDKVSPPGANIVSGMWIFRVKRPPGSPPVFKACYVARGFSQRQGVDYFQTFSPTPKMTTLRVLLHIAAQRDYELHSLDFSTAFLQGSLHEEIWLRHPPGFTGSFPPGTQWSLRRPVYGLRQAPREWHDTVRTTLAALGFAPSTADPSLFLRTNTSLPPFYILVYVDDLVFATADTAGLAHVKSELQNRHTCTDLGELRSYLGLQITRDRAQRTITLTQSHMVHQILQRFGFTYSSPQATPLPTRHSLSPLPSDESAESSGLYPELVGCLMYLMTCTRPDLAYPLSILARYVAPGRHRPEHMAAAKRVLRYVCCTSGMGLVLGGRRRVVLTGHADASWADDQATQRSSQGYTFSLGSGSVSWRSTRSSSVLGSSSEAEIYAGAMAAQELHWLTYLLTDLGEPPRSPPVLYVDNKAMLALCREHRLEHTTKHIALRYFLSRELQQRG
ncbi:unnamed protein product, partial [Closterium sp. NIES-65]